jgi:hypothetical protein
MSTMSTTIRTLLGLMLAATTGCAAFDKAPYMDPKVAAQVTVTKNEPPVGCAYVATVKGSTYTGDLGDAHAEVLRSAVLRGGNFVTVDLVERPMVIGLGGYAVRGRLYACPANANAGGALATSTAKPPAVAEQATVKPCEAECANGFQCQLGACVALPPAQAAGP